MQRIAWESVLGKPQLLPQSWGFQKSYGEHADVYEVFAGDGAGAISLAVALLRGAFILYILM